MEIKSPNFIYDRLHKLCYPNEYIVRKILHMKVLEYGGEREGAFYLLCQAGWGVPG
jgi:hypothetical protein